MGKNTSISLGDRYEAYARSKVESGEFSSVSEVVRGALRERMAKDEQIEGLRAIVQKSLDSGPAQEFDIDAWFEEKFGAQ